MDGTCKGGVGELGQVTIAHTPNVHVGEASQCLLIQTWRIIAFTILHLRPVT